MTKWQTSYPPKDREIILLGRIETPHGDGTTSSHPLLAKSIWCTQKSWIHPDTGNPVLQDEGDTFIIQSWSDVPDIVIPSETTQNLTSGPPRDARDYSNLLCYVGRKDGRIVGVCSAEPISLQQGGLEELNQPGVNITLEEKEIATLLYQHQLA